MKEKDLPLIKKVELFRGLKDDEINKILNLAFIKNYDADFRLFYEGSDGDVLYVILKGEIQLFKKGTDKPDHPIATLTDGSFLGEMSLIENQRRTATAIISKPTKLLIITQKAFGEMLQYDPRITSVLLMCFLRETSHRLRKMLSSHS